MSIYVKHNGVWTEVNSTYVKHNGVWTQTTPYVKHNGLWTEMGAIDREAPPIPTVVANVIDGRYLNVGVAVSGTNVTDLDTVRVLVSMTAQPGSWTSSGRITDVSPAWPNETWSDWKFNTTSRPDSSVMTYKTFPANADSTTLLTAGTYYISAFAKDTEGNISAAGTATAVIPYVPPAPPPPSDNTGGTPDPTLPPGSSGWMEFTTDFDAKWSRSWYGNALGTKNDGDVYSYGEHMRVGYWPDSGRMKAAIGFPSNQIQNTLRGAEVTKVSLYVHMGDCYRTTGKVRFRYHGLDYVPATWPVDADFGTYEEWSVPEKDGAWFNITSHTPSAWKTGAKKGMFFSPADDSTTRAIMFWGHYSTLPPKLRITYRVPAPGVR